MNEQYSQTRARLNAFKRASREAEIAFHGKQIVHNSVRDFHKRYSRKIKHTNTQFDAPA